MIYYDINNICQWERSLSETKRNFAEHTDIIIVKSHVLFQFCSRLQNWRYASDYEQTSIISFYSGNGHLLESPLKLGRYQALNRPQLLLIFPE